MAHLRETSKPCKSQNTNRTQKCYRTFSFWFFFSIRPYKERYISQDILYMCRERTSKGMKLAANRLGKMNHCTGWSERGKKRNSNLSARFYSSLAPHSVQWFILRRRFVANFIPLLVCSLYMFLGYTRSKNLLEKFLTCRDLQFFLVSIFFFYFRKGGEKSSQFLTEIK